MGLLLLLLEPSPWCAKVSIVLDKLLDVELQWHVELLEVGVVVVEGRYLFLSDLLDSADVLDYLDLIGLLLGHILHFDDTPWKGGRLLHYLDELESH